MNEEEMNQQPLQPAAGACSCRPPCSGGRAAILMQQNKMALLSCTKLSVGLMVAYVSYVSWTMYMLFFPALCDQASDPSRCITPLHDGDSSYKASDVTIKLISVVTSLMHCQQQPCRVISCSARHATL